MHQDIVIHAGPHDRVNVPLSVFLPDVAIDRPLQVSVPSPSFTGGCIDLYPTAAGTLLAGTIRNLPPSKAITISPADTTTTPASTVSPVEFRSGEDETIHVLLAATHFTTLHYSSALPRPFFYPVVGPAGEPVTRRYPMEAAGPYEKDDHPHHRSFWVAHGDVNGRDFWSESPGHGVQKVEGAPSILSGGASGILEFNTVWEHDGQPIVRDHRIFLFHAPGAGRRIIDVRLEFKAEYGDVTFGDTKEGGLAAFRVAGRMKGSAEGTIINAFGGIGERECWGAASPWVDYSGPTGTVVQGVTIMDHPLNYRYPTRWHVRDYGLFAVNPFALSYYKQSWDTDGSVTIREGSSLVFNYRVVIHSDQGSADIISRSFTDYLYPPRIEVRNGQ